MYIHKFKMLLKQRLYYSLLELIHLFFSNRFTFTIIEMPLKQHLHSSFLKYPFFLNDVLTFKITLMEPLCDKTNDLGFASREDSDKPGHTPSLTRGFAVRMKKA